VYFYCIAVKQEWGKNAQKGGAGIVENEQITKNFFEREKSCEFP